MDIDHSNRLQELLVTEEHGRVVLDLKDVTLVDRAAVDFLARVETAGVRIVNCPDYVCT
jgi:anti-anti-sigma regulatory factor